MAQTYSYCVDGSNVVRGAFGYGGPDFHEQEEADTRRLVEALAQVCDRLEARVEVDLFFDGGHRAWSGLSIPGNLHIRFTNEIQADDLILDRVRANNYGAAGKVTVVTGDGELGRKVSEEGGRWQRVSHGAALESVVGAIEGRLVR